MSRVIHFELCVKNPARAAKFYQTVFNWDVHQWGDNDYWLVHTGEGQGIDGAMLIRSEESDRTVNTLEVDSLEQAMAKVKKMGGKMVSDVMIVPEIGYLAYAEDSEGICFGMMERDENAYAELVGEEPVKKTSSKKLASKTAKKAGKAPSKKNVKKPAQKSSTKKKK